jgi:Secretion system C-terminal sorting domain
MVSSVKIEPGKRPYKYALAQCYPNPFNPATTIRYELPSNSRVCLKIYNLLGQIVTTLIDNIETAGYKSVNWNASSFASGIYFYRLEAISVANPSKTFTSVKKMVLLK